MNIDDKPLFGELIATQDGLTEELKAVTAQQPWDASVPESRGAFEG